MDRTADIIDKLAKLNQRYFSEKELQLMDISYSEIEYLTKNGFFIKDIFDPNGQHIVRYYLAESSYTFLIALKTEKSSNETKHLTEKIRILTWVMVVFVSFQIVIGIIQILIMLGSVKPMP